MFMSHLRVTGRMRYSVLFQPFGPNKTLMSSNALKAKFEQILALLS